MDRVFPIKGRYVILMCLVPLFYLPGIEFIYEFIGNEAELYWFDIAYYFYYHFVCIAALICLVTFHKVNWRLMFSPATRADYPGALKLTAFIFLFSTAAIYALFYPLSLISPEFVNLWLIDLPPVIYTSQNAYPIVANLLSFCSLVVLAPLIEEFAFRGLLLHRWNDKWGMTAAILLSSTLFGFMHPDPIGATAFGIAMSVLYLQTQTLIVPIVCHALNNFLVWLIEVGYMMANGPGYRYTLEEFQSDWPVGFTCGVISIVWIYSYINSKQNQKVWQLPKI